MLNKLKKLLEPACVGCKFSAPIFHKPSLCKCYLFDKEVEPTHFCKRFGLSSYRLEKIGEILLSHPEYINNKEVLRLAKNFGLTKRKLYKLQQFIKFDKFNKPQ